MAAAGQPHPTHKMAGKLPFSAHQSWDPAALNIFDQSAHDTFHWAVVSDSVGDLAFCQIKVVSEYSWRTTIERGWQEPDWESAIP